jgi:hypothetical protein
MSLYKMLGYQEKGFVPEAVPPIPSAHVLRMRVLELRAGYEYVSVDVHTADRVRWKALSDRNRYMSPYWSLDGAVVAPLLLAAPLLERVYLDKVRFSAAQVEALTAAVVAGTALRRMRLICIDSGSSCLHQVQPLLDTLLVRMREFCPLFQSGLVSPDRDTYGKFWQKHYCKDNWQKEFD